jgi:hypothetical protein
VRRGGVKACDWEAVAATVDRAGVAVTPAPLLSAAECRALRDGFGDDGGRYRSTVDMARYRFGEGVYRYFAHPLPDPVQRLRTEAYPALARLSTIWNERLGNVDIDDPNAHFPDTLSRYLDICHENAQMLSTPLTLRYEAGGWNALHQDLYGDVAFPLQLTVALTRAGDDFTGGEHVFVEQRPRQQSRPIVVTVPRGHAVVFPTRHRPVEGTRGWYRATFRHGVSEVRTGTRLTLGVIFHDAA